MARWKVLACPSCGGRGVVPLYTLGGTDFIGPSECPDCNGGVVFVSDKDRVADYPGGPLRGQWPGAFARAARGRVKERGRQ
jgi:hypothetical protein